MSREIKFRAWHPEWDEMVYSTQDHDWFGKREFYPFCFEVGFSHYPADDGWTLMQYTGWHDRDGREIYEHDILEWYDATVPKGIDKRRRKVVEWNGIGWNIDQNTRIYTVVGNVHENPELLTTPAP